MNLSREKSSKMDKKTLISLFESMLYNRLVEEKVCTLYPEQEMRCPVHISIGEEANASGVCKSLNTQDIVLSNHRCHGSYLAKRGNLKKFFAELYGKYTGCAKGRGGSMHLVDLSVGFMGATPIVANTIPVAVGVALSLSMQKNNSNIVVVFLGEAATEEGVFHESINFAKLKNLPILFFCENNLYSVYTPLHLRQPKRKIVDIVSANGLHCYEIDGNDVVTVYETSKEAIRKIRKGEGPAFIEASTYRWREHCGPYYDDHLDYRPKGELQEWKKKDPIKRVKEKLINESLITEKQIMEFKKKINKQIEVAVKFAKSSKFPDKKELEKYIYAD